MGEIRSTLVACIFSSKIKGLVVIPVLLDPPESPFVKGGL